MTSTKTSRDDVIDDVDAMGDDVETMFWPMTRSVNASRRHRLDTNTRLSRALLPRLLDADRIFGRTDDDTLFVRVFSCAAHDRECSMGACIIARFVVSTRDYNEENEIFSKKSSVLKLF